MSDEPTDMVTVEALLRHRVSQAFEKERVRRIREACEDLNRRLAKAIGPSDTPGHQGTGR